MDLDTRLARPPVGGTKADTAAPPSPRMCDEATATVATMTAVLLVLIVEATNDEQKVYMHVYFLKVIATRVGVKLQNYERYMYERASCRLQSADADGADDEAAKVAVDPGPG